MTATDQSYEPADIKMSADIRKMVVGADPLSTMAKNVRVVTIGGVVPLRGLGPFIAAGPIIAALSGAAAGATAGGVVGALVGLRIPEYEGPIMRIKQGEYLVVVHVDSEKEEAVRDDEGMVCRTPSVSKKNSEFANTPRQFAWKRVRAHKIVSKE